MAGASDEFRAKWRRWWNAPAALQVLVGPERYLGAVLGALIAFAIPMVTIGIVNVILWPDQPGFHRGAIAASLALGILVAIFWRPIVRGRFREGAIVPSVVIVAISLGFQVPLYGPQGGEAADLFVAATVVAALWVPRRWSVVAMGSGAITYGVFMALGDYSVPLFRWAAVIGSAIAVLVAITRVLDLVIDLAAEGRDATAHAKRLAAAERASAEVADQARETLAVLNDILGERVQEQVAEIERLGELRRFLSGPVADAVLAAHGGPGPGHSLAPHRRRIAVVYVDLRGFTSFSSTAEPEELLEVLDGYYAVVGQAVRRHEATVGAFQGDGIMAYFNDPIPCLDPAGTAVTMAMELRPALDELSRAWSRRGFDLSYGIGISYGEATLGTVGFEGRTDYAPLGTVVNLSLELCDEAGRGEILIDEPTCRELAERPSGERCELELTGFGATVAALRIPAAAT